MPSTGKKRKKGRGGREEGPLEPFLFHPHHLPAVYFLKRRKKGKRRGTEGRHGLRTVAHRHLVRRPAQKKKKRERDKGGLTPASTMGFFLLSVSGAGARLGGRYTIERKEGKGDVALISLPPYHSAYPKKKKEGEEGGRFGAVRALHAGSGGGIAGAWEGKGEKIEEKDTWARELLRPGKWAKKKKREKLHHIACGFHAGEEEKRRAIRLLPSLLVFLAGRGKRSLSFFLLFQPRKERRKSNAIASPLPTKHFLLLFREGGEGRKLLGKQNFPVGRKNPSFPLPKKKGEKREKEERIEDPSRRR